MTEPPRRLFLLDGHSLAYRAFFALPPTLATTSGQVTNAVYGFTSMLIKLLGEEHPDLLAVAFDMGRPTVRLEKYAEYKAGRRETPDEFRQQLGLIVEVLETPAHPGRPDGGPRGRRRDRDPRAPGQRAGDRRRDRHRGPGLLPAGPARDRASPCCSTARASPTSPVRRRGGQPSGSALPPAKYLDYVALKGDTSDNIPGVPGVGEKTASKLVQDFGSVEELLAHTDELKGEAPGVDPGGGRPARLQQGAGAAGDGPRPRRHARRSGDGGVGPRRGAAPVHLAGVPDAARTAGGGRRRARLKPARSRSRSSDLRPPPRPKGVATVSHGHAARGVAVERGPRIAGLAVSPGGGQAVSRSSVPPRRGRVARRSEEAEVGARRQGAGDRRRRRRRRARGRDVRHAPGRRTCSTRRGAGAIRSTRCAGTYLGSDVLGTESESERAEAGAAVRRGRLDGPRRRGRDGAPRAGAWRSAIDQAGLRDPAATTWSSRCRASSRGCRRAASGSTSSTSQEMAEGVARPDGDARKAGDLRAAGRGVQPQLAAAARARSSTTSSGCSR